MLIFPLKLMFSILLHSNKFEWYHMTVSLLTQLFSLYLIFKRHLLMRDFFYLRWLMVKYSYYKIQTSLQEITHTNLQAFYIVTY